MTTALPWLKATLIDPRDPLWIACALGVICVVFAIANLALIWARSREIPEFRKTGSPSFEVGTTSEPPLTQISLKG